MNPDLDLVLTRDVAHPPAALWRAWTEPALLKEWFCPAPWKLAEVEIDLRPGGRYNSVMAGPDGERVDSKGCYTEVIPERRLAFTDALSEGWRPTGTPFMTAIITFEPIGSGTRYTATALHADPDARERHETMGFHQGWNAALDQLITLLERTA